MERRRKPALSSVRFVWFRDDLRTTDNPALIAAINRGSSMSALYVLDEESPGIRPLGSAEIVGITLWVIGMTFELTADLQNLHSRPAPKMRVPSFTPVSGRAHNTRTILMRLCSGKECSWSRLRCFTAGSG